MARLRIFGLLGLLLVLSLACSGGGSITPTPEKTSEPTEAPISGGQFKITIDNQSKHDICDVRISSSESESWGSNLLDGKIGKGKSKAFTMDSGTYDVIVYDCDDVALASAWGINSKYTLTVGGSGLVELVL